MEKTEEKIQFRSNKNVLGLYFEVKYSRSVAGTAGDSRRVEQLSLTLHELQHYEHSRGRMVMVG